MKIAIFGATGKIGRHLVSQGLDRGFEVSAITRDASGANLGRLNSDAANSKTANLGTADNNLSVCEADVVAPGSAAVVSELVAGHDAVLVTLGAGLRGTVRSAGTQNIVEAMEQADVKRLVCQTTLGVGDSRNNLNFKWRYIMFGALLRAAYEDHVRQEDIVRSSNLNWTIVRPSAFDDAAVRGGFEIGFGPDRNGLELAINPADVAGFMLDQAEMSEHIGCAVSISQ